jgi:hypothetical protein
MTTDLNYITTRRYRVMYWLLKWQSITHASNSFDTRDDLTLLFTFWPISFWYAERLTFATIPAPFASEPHGKKKICPEQQTQPPQTASALPHLSSGDTMNSYTAAWYRCRQYTAHQSISTHNRADAIGLTATSRPGPRIMTSKMHYFVDTTLIWPL